MALSAVAWFADQVTAAFAQALIPLRNTGVAVRDGDRWRLVQVQLSAAVPDEELLNG